MKVGGSSVSPTYPVHGFKTVRELKNGNTLFADVGERIKGNENEENPKTIF